MSEQDPLINVRQDEETDDLSVSLYGEVQREVIQATLDRDYGIAASFHDTTVIYIERPVGPGTGGTGHQCADAYKHLRSLVP